jgi:hypothetical protein
MCAHDDAAEKFTSEQRWQTQDLAVGLLMAGYYEHLPRFS